MVVGPESIVLWPGMLVSCTLHPVLERYFPEAQANVLHSVSRDVLAHETVDCLLLSHSLFLKAGIGAGAIGGYTISPEVTDVYTEWDVQNQSNTALEQSHPLSAGHSPLLGQN